MIKSLPLDENGAHRRMQFSYGAWSELASLLGAAEFVKLQALSNYCYSTSISRAQPRIVLPKPIQVLTCRNFPKSVFLCVDGQAEWTKIESEYFDFSTPMTETILLGRRLYSLSRNDTFTVHKYGFTQKGAFTGKNLVYSRRLESDKVLNFALAVVKSRYILITGGVSHKFKQYQTVTLMFDTQIGQLVEHPAHPSLCTGRAYHSSCSTEGHAFVFGGNSPQFLTNSLEYLELGTAYGSGNYPESY